MTTTAPQSSPTARPLIATSASPFDGEPSLSSPPPAASSAATDPRSTVCSHYDQRRLWAPPAGHSFVPTAFNASGDIAGNIVQPARYEGATWRATGLLLGAHSTESPPSVTAELAHPFQSVSSDGRLAGTSGVPISANRAWASHRGIFGESYWPGSASFAQGVNTAGTVVGKTLLPAEALLITRAFVLELDQRPRFLTPPGGGMTDAIAVNDRGTVLVNATPLHTRAVTRGGWLFVDGDFHPLEAPTGCPTHATALTPGDRVVGHVETASGLVCAALWRSGRLVDLGTPFLRDFRPLAANDQETVVGTALNDFGTRSACRWTAARGLEFLSDLTLPTPGMNLTRPVAIDDVGRILVVSTFAGQTTGIMLEPAS